jgi:hypothetical protein
MQRAKPLSGRCRSNAALLIYVKVTGFAGLYCFVVLAATWCRAMHAALHEPLWEAVRRQCETLNFFAFAALDFGNAHIGGS